MEIFRKWWTVLSQPHTIPNIFEEIGLARVCPIHQNREAAKVWSTIYEKSLDRLRIGPIYLGSARSVWRCGIGMNRPRISSRTADDQADPWGSASMEMDGTSKYIMCHTKKYGTLGQNKLGDVAQVTKFSTQVPRYLEHTSIVLK